MPILREDVIDGLYRRGTRPLAGYLAQYRWITPNRISLAGFLVGGVGASICILTRPLWTAGILFALGDILDYLDGDLAGTQGTGSREGAIFDAVLDRYTDFLVIGTLVYVTGDSALLVGLAALLGAMLTPYIRAKTEAQGKNSVNTVGERGWRNRIMVVGLLLGQPFWTMAAIAVVANFSALHRLTFALRKG